jgi:hypothetical protein
MRASASLGQSAVLAALIACGNAHGADAIPRCQTLPAVSKMSEPDFPEDVEPRGLPNPVTVLVEFTLHQDGSVSDPVAIEVDAGSYVPQFKGRAVQAILRTRFKPGALECRGRMKVAFKLVAGPHA